MSLIPSVSVGALVMVTGAPALFGVLMESDVGPPWVVLLVVVLLVGGVSWIVGRRLNQWFMSYRGSDSPTIADVAPFLALVVLTFFFLFSSHYTISFGPPN